MKFFRPPIIATILLLAATQILEARSNFRGYSGAPGRQTCAISCHGNSNGTVIVAGFPDIYEPGMTYTIDVSHDGGSSIRNFNASCRLGTGTSTAGELDQGTGTDNYSVNGESNGVQLSSYGRDTATFYWTAPEAGAGEARFYMGAFQGTNENTGSTTEIEIVMQEGASLPQLVIAAAQIASDSDGDGVLEIGEDAYLVISLENTGGMQSGITGTISTADERIQILASTSSWPDLSGGDVMFNAEALQVYVNEEASPVFEAVLNLHLMTDSGELDLPFTIIVGEWTLIAETDVEDDAPDWYHFSPEGWGDNWHVSQESSSTGEQSFKCGADGAGDYGDELDTWLVSPPMTLLAYSQLSFMHRMQAEISSAYPDSAYDGGVLMISTDDGASWEQLAAGYTNWFRYETGSGDPASHPFAGGTPCFSGELDWTRELVDLSGWEDQTVRLAFRFGSDSGTTDEGWYIDDILIQGYFEEDTKLGSELEQPTRFALLNVWPNPFNPLAQIDYTLPVAGQVKVALHDLAGREVMLLAEGQRSAGEHRLVLNGHGLASGIYLITLSSGDKRVSKRITLLR